MNNNETISGFSTCDEGYLRSLCPSKRLSQGSLRPGRKGYLRDLIKNREAVSEFSSNNGSYPRGLPTLERLSQESGL